MPGGRRRGRAWTSTSASGASRATAASPSAAWMAIKQVPVSRSAGAKRPQRTSSCGRLPRPASPPGRPAGAPGVRAGTSSAAQWRRGIWVTRWTSTAGAPTSYSRTTRTRSRRARPPTESSMRRLGCIVPLSGAPGTRRCPSRLGTLSPSATCLTSTMGRPCASTSCPPSTASPCSTARRASHRPSSGSCASTPRCAAWSCRRRRRTRPSQVPSSGSASTAPCPMTLTR
mmetsp:Transcript_135546/g.421099  ORF Transcript_135546/g.421099 Transcript_135546/m.421099 type:complete len:229 (+) Transcript_135546:91-777(+)